MMVINKMKKISGFAVYLCALTCLLPVVLIQQAQAAEKELLLFQGQIKVLRIGGVERVALGNAKVISTSIIKNGQLVVIGEKKGTTTMHIWKDDGREDDYKVSVTEEDSSGSNDDLSGLVAGMNGVKVRTVSGKTILEGVVSPQQKLVLKALGKNYPAMLDLTRESEVAGDSQMVLLNVRFTEFKTNRLDKVGISWATDINGPSAGYANLNTTNLSSSSTADGLNDVFPGAVINPLTSNPPLGYFGIVTEITSRLNFLASNGDALILAEPRLSARSGGSAEFVAGGEVPIPIEGSDGKVTIEYKKYGIILKVKPIADDKGHVQASVDTEVSTIDQSVNVRGAPGFLTRSTRTDVSLKDGETLVISGLVSHNISDGATKVKGLGDLPILGRLFSSDDFQSNKSELVIFVTPVIYDADSETNIQSVKRSDELQQRFKDAVNDDSILD